MKRLIVSTFFLCLVLVGYAQQKDSNAIKTYNGQLAAYKNGKLGIHDLPKLALIAKSLNEKNTAQEVADNYINNYLLKLREKELFTKENLGFIGDFMGTAEGKAFKLIKQQSKKINTLLGDYWAQNKIMDFIYTNYLPLDLEKSKETNWDELEKTVVAKFGSLGKEIVWGQRMIHYLMTGSDWKSYGKYYKLYYQIALKHPRRYYINELSWALFENVKDQKVLEFAVEVMRYDIEVYDTNSAPAFDTYANLLYKTGKTTEAIEWESKALQISKGTDDEKVFEEILNKMKKGVSTWDKQTNAQFSIPACFSNNMVLQRNQKDPVWGTANAGVNVSVEFLQKKYETKANAEGKWMVRLDVKDAGGPYSIKITTEDTVVEFNNILIGEVWVCSGQSNMEMPLEGWPNGDGTYRCRIKNYEQEITDAKYPDIRLLQLETRSEQDKVTDVKVLGNSWRECSPNTIRTFSSTAYFFAREIYKKTGVPIGLIESSAGGSVIEAWSDFEPEREHTGGLYNGMIAPLIPFGIRGVLWYQGEFNTGNAWEYQTLLSSMIKDWRNKWGQGDFPFYFMQLPVIGDRTTVIGKSSWAELREAQFKTLSVPNTAMAVSIDLPDNDLHPANKQDFGERFALIALSKLYGKKNTYTGPLYRSFKDEGNVVRLFFSNAEDGIRSRNDEDLKGFSIAGADSIFYEAKAKIDGNSIVVSSDKISQPISVRYAWADYPVNNLVNKEGLPASPFRTDNWELTTSPKNIKNN